MPRSPRRPAAGLPTSTTRSLRGAHGRGQRRSPCHHAALPQPPHRASRYRRIRATPVGRRTSRLVLSTLLTRASRTMKKASRPPSRSDAPSPPRLSSRRQVGCPRPRVRTDRASSEVVRRLTWSMDQLSPRAPLCPAGQLDPEYPQWPDSTVSLPLTVHQHRPLGCVLVHATLGIRAGSADETADNPWSHGPFADQLAGKR
jgi:hypothetical protein